MSVYNRKAIYKWRAKNKERYQEYMRQWRAEHPEKLAVYKERMGKYNTPAHYRKSNLKRYYGLTPEAYDALFNAQGGVCAICGEPPGKRRLAVDHDHKTGLNRGLLCYVCNAALNKFEKYPDFGDRAIRYLVQYIEQLVRS